MAHNPLFNKNYSDYKIDYSVKDLSLRLDILQSSLEDICEWDSHNNDLLNDQIFEIMKAIKEIKVKTTLLNTTITKTDLYDLWESEDKEKKQLQKYV